MHKNTHWFKSFLRDALPEKLNGEDYTSHWCLNRILLFNETENLNVEKTAQVLHCLWFLLSEPERVIDLWPSYRKRKVKVYSTCWIVVVLFYPLIRKTSLWPSVCLCSSRFIWESQPENIRAFHSFFFPRSPRCLTCPPRNSLLISSRSDHLFLWAHGKWAEFIATAAASAAGLLVQNVVASLSLSLSFSLSLNPHLPLHVSPPVVFWVMGKHSLALLSSPQKLCRLLYRASPHASCYSVAYYPFDH